MHDRDNPSQTEREGLAHSQQKENAGAGEAGGLLNTSAETRKSTYPIDAKMREQLDTRFKYHAPKGDQAARYSSLREHGLSLAEHIVSEVPPGREQALALTKLEEAIMHANAGIARGE